MNTNFEDYHQIILDKVDNDQPINELELQTIIEEQAYLIFYENNTYKFWELKTCLEYFNWVYDNYKDIFYSKLAEREIVYGNNSINLHIKRIVKRLFYLVSVEKCKEKSKLL